MERNRAAESVVKIGRFDSSSRKLSESAREDRGIARENEGARALLVLRADVDEERIRLSVLKRSFFFILNCSARAV